MRRGAALDEGRAETRPQAPPGAPRGPRDAVAVEEVWIDSPESTGGAEAASGPVAGTHRGRAGRRGQGCSAKVRRLRRGSCHFPRENDSAAERASTAPSCSCGPPVPANEGAAGALDDSPPHSAGRKGAEAAFEPKCPAHISAKPSGKKRSRGGIHRPAPPTAPRQGGWDAADSAAWPAASGRRSETLSPERIACHVPPRGRRPETRASPSPRERAPAWGSGGVFSCRVTVAPPRPWKPQRCRNETKHVL